MVHTIDRNQCWHPTMKILYWIFEPLLIDTWCDALGRIILHKRNCKRGNDFVYLVCDGIVCTWLTHLGNWKLTWVLLLNVNVRWFFFNIVMWLHMKVQFTQLHCCIIALGATMWSLVCMEIFSVSLYLPWCFESTMTFSAFTYMAYNMLYALWPFELGYLSMVQIFRVPLQYHYLCSLKLRCDVVSSLHEFVPQARQANWYKHHVVLIHFLLTDV